MSVHFNRIVESHTQDAQRIEDTAESRPLVESSNVPREPSFPTELTHRTQEQALRSRSKKFKELRQLGAVDFYGTTDPAEAETLLKRTERVFRMMRYTREEQFDFAVSLLQGTHMISGRRFPTPWPNHRC